MILCSFLLKLYILIDHDGLKLRAIRILAARILFKVTFCLALTPEQLMLTVGESHPTYGLHVLQNKQLFHCFNTWSLGVQSVRERFTGVFICLSQIVWMISFLFLANINTDSCRGLSQERSENGDLFLSPNVSCKYLQFLNGYFKMCCVYLKIWTLLLALLLLCNFSYYNIPSSDGIMRSLTV